jgi:alcohol dehydrogenase
VHLKSTHGRPAPLDQTRVVVNELRLVGSRCGTSGDFEEAIRLLRGGAVVPPPVKVVWGLEKAPEAFREALRRDVFRLVLRVSRTPWETGWGQRS